MKILSILVVATLASLSSFVVHIVTVEWLPMWINTQMQGTQVMSSWNVRYIAAVTSVEYGISACIIYLLLREKLLTFGVVNALIGYAVLLAGLHGAFVRQPLMDYIVGNPIHVVLVQNGFKWLVWILMSMIVVLGTEIIIKKFEAKRSKLL